MTQSEKNMKRPLDGIRVIDVSRVLAGPLCGQMLADMGADVIKVESPGGDENRQWAPIAEDGESCNFMSVNRGKRGVTLNLKSEQGKTILYALLESADVMIHSFLPHTAQVLGIVESDLRERFPKLIVCSVSAFGAKGELADRPGYDALLQAFSGIMSFTGERNGGPVRSGVSFVDMTTGILAYAGVVTALMGRAQFGNGNAVHASLLETAVSLLGYHGVGWMSTGALPKREGSGLWHLVPYQVFQCKDGEVLTGALNDGTWSRLCKAVDRPDLQNDPSLATNAGRLARRDEIIREFEAIFSAQNVEYWLNKLESGGVPIAPLHTIDQALSHPQSLANEMVVELISARGESLRLLGSGFKVGHGPNHAPRRPPLLGEHCEEILQEVAGYSQEEISRFRQEGVI